jgi:hypothetical protein
MITRRLKRWIEWGVCGCLLALASIPIAPAVVAGAIMYLFNDTNNPGVPAQIAQIISGIAALCFSVAATAILIATGRKWVAVFSLAFLAFGYQRLAPFKGLIMAILMSR